MIDKNDIYWNEMKNTNYLEKKFLEMVEELEINVTDFFECTESSYNQCLQQFKNSVQLDALEDVQLDALEGYLDDVIRDLCYFLHQLDYMAKYDSIVDVSGLIVKVEKALKVLDDAENTLYQKQEERAKEA
jgi:hypothetical protein